MASKMTSYRFPEETLAKLDKIATATHHSRTQVIIDCIDVLEHKFTTNNAPCRVGSYEYFRESALRHAFRSLK